jgi:hypothetical protein
MTLPAIAPTICIAAVALGVPDNGVRNAARIDGGGFGYLATGLTNATKSVGGSCASTNFGLALIGQVAAAVSEAEVAKRPGGVPDRRVWTSIGPRMRWSMSGSRRGQKGGF